MFNNRASWADTKNFYLKVFSAIDEDVNGCLSDKEFKKFLLACDIHMTQDSFNEIYDRCNAKNRGKLTGKFTFDDFVTFMEEYRKKFNEKQTTRMSAYVTDNGSESGSFSDDALENLFHEIDVDKSGTITFREIMVFCKTKGLRLGYGEILAFMKYFDQDGDGELKIEEIKKKILNQANLSPGMAFVPDAPNLSNALQAFAPRAKKSEKERQIQRNFVDVRQSMLTLLRPKFENELEHDEIENMRWATFVDFHRQIGDDDVMTSKPKIVREVLPGRYNLDSLADFGDLPVLKPNYTEVKGVAWISGINGKPGVLVFPDNFDGDLETEFATNELLDYYGCSIANTRRDDKIEVDLRHAIQDFTYSENYLEKYVLSPKSAKGNGGAGMERHDFHHLDCPLDQNNGYFILTKYPDEDDESVMHFTAFRIPVRHTLFVPGGTMHSNDYLKGTWRTMLSDAAPIDYIHLEREGKNFRFTFKKL